MDHSSYLPEELSSLPQFGFNDELTFDVLKEQNPFLFRVYTPRKRSPLIHETGPFFVAQLFNEHHNSAPAPLSHLSSISKDVAASATYADVVQHMDWTTRTSSPYISTSFSFAWAIWEATRRYRDSMKHDIEIAVIDAQALVGRAATAVELLRKGESKERHRDHGKWYKFATESQDVLVLESIPADAIFASIPLVYILERLPSYFLRPDLPETKSSPFDRLAWTLPGCKSSYRNFCQTISEHFLDMPIELRLRDTTVGAVRLSISLLRTWFLETVTTDTRKAASTLCKLSFVLAQWPGQWWARDHSEMWGIIRATVQVVLEETQEHEKSSLEDSRLRDLLIGDVAPFTRHFHFGEPRTRTQSCMECAFPPRLRTSSWSGSSATATDSDTADTRSVHTLVEEGNITQDSVLFEKEAVKKMMEHVDMVSPEPSASMFSSTITVIEEVLHAPPSPTLSTESILPPSMVASTSSSSSPSSADTCSSESADSPDSSVPSSPETPSTLDGKLGPISIPHRRDSLRPQTVAETASCLMTGILFGALIALCIVASQRRVLAMHVY